MNLSKEKAVALKAASKAEKILLSYFGKNEQIRQKSNKSLVSKADIQANNAVISAIKENFPRHNIISEEIPPQNNQSDFTWYIDPLDGTHNFIHKIPVFGVSIALAYKDEVVLGVIYMPLLKLRAFAEKGKGAFINGKKINVSKKDNLKHGFVLFELSYSKRSVKIKFMEQFVGKLIDLRNFGAAVYHLLLVASGMADAFIIYTTREWDVAAGFLMVTEAGGKITNTKGEKCTLTDRNYIVSNSRVHDELMRMVKKV